MSGEGAKDAGQVRLSLPVERHQHVRTTCGRELTVGTLTLGDKEHPARRIFVDLGDCAECDGASWAGLTPGEARELALLLLSEAAAADQERNTGAAGRQR